MINVWVLGRCKVSNSYLGMGMDMWGVFCRVLFEFYLVVGSGDILNKFGMEEFDFDIRWDDE